MKKLNSNFGEKNNKDSYAIAVAIALLLATVLLVVYYIYLQPPQDRYMNVYILDTHRKAVDYPEFLVANVNSTFSVYVDVENHLGYDLNGAQIQVKATSSGNPTFPLQVEASQSFTVTVPDGKTWEKSATVSLDEPGTYLVAFELWLPQQNTTALQFSGKYCALSVQVVAENSTSH